MAGLPTYEYACRQCGTHLDVVQKFSDEPLTTCPGCAGPLRKVFGSIGISFKGSGFYKTDSRTDNGNGNGGKRSDREPAAGETSSKSGDSPSSAGGAKSEGAKSEGAKSDSPKADAPKAAS